MVLQENPQEYPFVKMNGLGNDFIIFDCRYLSIDLGFADYSKLSDRSGSYGCDQIILIESDSGSDAFMRIYNGNGSESGACGNALRCVAFLLMEEQGRTSVRIRTRNGILRCHRLQSSRHIISADMGEPLFSWASIPLSFSTETLFLDYNFSGNRLDLPVPAVVNIGNPHCVFFLEEIEDFPLSFYGPKIENDSIFPAKANISIVKILSKDHLSVRVWERNTGITSACGSAACASLVLGFCRGLCSRSGTVSLPGGDLRVEWSKTDNRICQTGLVEENFRSSYKAVSSS